MANISDKIFQLDRTQEEAQAKARAQKLHIPYIEVAKIHLDEGLLKLIPKEHVEALQCLPIVLHDGKMTVGVVEPESEGVTQGLKSLEQMTGYHIQPALISASSYAFGRKTYDLIVRENEGERPMVLTDQDMDNQAKLLTQLQSGEAIANLSVTDLFIAVLGAAIKQLATDIHFEPMEKEFEVRFRIDGVLHHVLKRPIQEFRGLQSRIKYLAKMPLSAAVAAQDGRFTITVLNIPLDVRVASLPTVYGDMITLRILPHQQVTRTVKDLGLRADLESIVHTAIQKPHGMVLVTGPTGSGKTTTLYSLLNELNSEERKIITIEDPVEYKIPGLEQSQVDPEHDYSFVAALRGALRQDPDVLMIGEIRDKETAVISVRAALTGHIVLATMHSNSAPAAYSRLLEMGVEPFLFSGSINVIIAQRLVRLLCNHCKVPREATPEEKKVLMRELGRVPESVFEPKGCSECDSIGYRGRTAVFEAFVPSHTIEHMAVLHSSLTTFEEQAHKDGMISMLQDGLLKVEQGVTSISEVYRVTAE